jgi:hypothetical protein
MQTVDILEPIEVEYVPEIQLIQISEIEAPYTVEYVPAIHFEQVVVPAVEEN